MVYNFCKIFIILFHFFSQEIETSQKSIISEAEKVVSENFQSYSNYVDETCVKMSNQYEQSISRVDGLNERVKEHQQLVEKFVYQDFQQDIKTGMI